MAKAYQCDVCKTLYIGFPAKRLLMGDYDNRDGGHFKMGTFDADICPSCMESVKHFIKSKDPNHKSVFEDKEDPTVHGNLFDGD